ncbi:MAG: DUF5671 domain-containing protein [Candidatus Paceibacterota bacterium]|jgi:hypothetical protein
MITIVIIGVGILFFATMAGAIYFTYSLITKNKYMHEDQKTKALDVFVYLGIGISLVVSITNILQIVFRAIEQRWRDVLDAGVSIDVYNSDVRMAIASLVVMYPIYLGLSWYVSKDIAKFLYKRDLKIRKVLIYVILFVSICTLIGALVSLIYTYLGGELSVRFALKTFTVFTVALSVFGYYLYSMRRDYSKESYVPLIASITATLVVLASLFWSIAIIGTPSEMRAKRIDSERLSNLSSLQQQIFNRFQSTDKLPTSLMELNDAFQGYSVPVDPVTGGDYVYKVLQQPVVRMNYTTNKKELVTQAVFEICANFDTVRDSTSQYVSGSNVAKYAPTTLIDAPYAVSNYYYEGDQSPFWNHDIGEACFKRVISPEMYYGK